MEANITLNKYIHEENMYINVDNYISLVQKIFTLDFTPLVCFGCSYSVNDHSFIGPLPLRVKETIIYKQ